MKMVKMQPPDWAFLYNAADESMELETHGNKTYTLTVKHAEGIIAILSEFLEAQAVSHDQAERLQ